MKTSLLLLTIGLLVVLIGGLALGMIRGSMWGLHPIHKKVARIAKAQYPAHYWGYTLLHIVMFIVLAWVIVGLWTAPAF